MLAGGQDSDELTERLRELQALAAQAADPGGLDGGAPLVGNAGFELHAFPIADLLAPVPQFVAPGDWRRMDDGPVFVRAAEETFSRWGNSEEILEHLRDSAPLRWDHPDAALMQINPRMLIATQSPATAADLRVFVNRHLRNLAHRTVAIEVEWIDMPQALALELASHPMELTHDARSKLEQARKAGVAESRFAGRMLALSGQSSVLWHGVQAAHVAAAEVEVAEESQTSDPTVGVEQLGTTLAARVHLTGPGRRNQIAVRFVSDRLDVSDKAAGDWLVRSTHDTGTLQLASRRYADGRARLELHSGAWGVATVGRIDGPRGDGSGWRVLLVRAVELTSEGAAR